MMSTPSTDEVSRVPDPDPYEAAGILTYDSSFNSTLLDSNMNSSSILTMAAESSGINLEEDLLTTPSKHTFDMDMDIDLDNWEILNFIIKQTRIKYYVSFYTITLSKLTLKKKHARILSLLLWFNYF